jgi:hypothetical protein
MTIFRYFAKLIHKRRALVYRFEACLKAQRKGLPT